MRQLLTTFLLYNTSLDIISENDDLKPKSIEKCRRRNNWPKQKKAFQTELNSLAKHVVFGPVVQTSEGLKLVGYK